MSRRAIHVCAIGIVGYLIYGVVDTAWFLWMGRWWLRVSPQRNALSPHEASQALHAPWWLPLIVSLTTVAMLAAWLFEPRRRWRLRLGRCPNCAYPIGQSPVCTECGKPVRVNSS